MTLTQWIILLIVFPPFVIIIWAFAIVGVKLALQLLKDK